MAEIVPEVPVTVTVYVPGVVPEFPPLWLLPPPPPQPRTPPETKIANSSIIASQLRLLRGTASNRTRANAIPPAGRHAGRPSALVEAVVETVSVEVCAVVPLSATDAGESEHAGGSLAGIGVIEQVRFTVPEKPLMPTTLMVAVFPVVAPG